MKKKETSSRVDTVTVPISLVVRCVSSDSVVWSATSTFWQDRLPHVACVFRSREGQLSTPVLALE